MKIAPECPKIIVVGSVSVDLILNTEKFPQPNETLMAVKSYSVFGGKGSNQAVGTSRLGASVYLISCIGMDPMGQQVMRNLLNEGVNVGFIHETEDADTGTAYVTSSEGKNTIVVVPAANHHLKPQHVIDAEKYFETADLILFQLEIPMSVLEETVRLAKKYGVRVGLYAAPAQMIPQEIRDYASFIIAKASELTVIFGEGTPEDILKMYPNKLFVRENINSTTYFDGFEMKYLRKDMDGDVYKMGMGDAFTSGFAVAFCNGNTVEDCVRFGNEVSFSVSRQKGSQDGLPYLKDMVL